MGKFRGLIDPAAYKDYILIILFIKYISDVWKDKYNQLEQEHGDEPELIKTLIQEERFVIPEGASFDDLYKKRHQPGLGERIDVAKSAIEEANPKLDRVFMGTSFNSDQLGDEKQKNELLKSVLDAFGDASIDLSPSKVGSLDIIGGAYEFLISDFAANAGKKQESFNSF